MSKTKEEDITEPCTPEGISEWAYTAANRSEGMSISQAVRIGKMIESYGNTYAEKMAVEFAEWIRDNAILVSINYYKLDTQKQGDARIYLPSDLYKLFTQQNQK